MSGVAFLVIVWFGCRMSLNSWFSDKNTFFYSKSDRDTVPFKRFSWVPHSLTFRLTMPLKSPSGSGLCLLSTFISHHSYLHQVLDTKIHSLFPSFSSFSSQLVLTSGLGCCTYCGFFPPLTSFTSQFPGTSQRRLPQSPCQTALPQSQCLPLLCLFPPEHCSPSEMILFVYLLSTKRKALGVGGVGRSLAILFTDEHPAPGTALGTQKAFGAYFWKECLKKGQREPRQRKREEEKKYVGRKGTTVTKRTSMGCFPHAKHCLCAG